MTLVLTQMLRSRFRKPSNQPMCMRCGAWRESTSSSERRSLSKMPSFANSDSYPCKPRDLRNPPSDSSPASTPCISTGAAAGAAAGDDAAAADDDDDGTGLTESSLFRPRMFGNVLLRSVKLLFHHTSSSHGVGTGTGPSVSSSAFGTSSWRMLRAGAGVRSGRRGFLHTFCALFVVPVPALALSLSSSSPSVVGPIAEGPSCPMFVLCSLCLHKTLFIKTPGGTGLWPPS